VVDRDVRPIIVGNTGDPLRRSALEIRESVNPGGSESSRQTLSEFLQDRRPGETDSSHELADPNRSTAAITDRKRRLTSIGDDGSRHRSGNDQRWTTPSSTNYADFETRPSLAPPQSRDGDLGRPGTSRDNAIDLPDPDTSVPRPMEFLPPGDSYIDFGLPQWQPDSEVSKCPICEISFSFWYRKHHCRKCGRVVCASCSPHRITIPRQFIVRPPDPNRSPSTFFQPDQSEIRAISLAGSENSHPSASNIQTRQYGQRGGQWLDSALGGGEEVRLCNPCVPDPNPEPPRRYSAVGSSLSRSERPSWSADPRERSHTTGSRNFPQQDYYDNPGSRNYNAPIHRPSHAFSSTTTPRSEVVREFRRQRGRGMVVPLYSCKRCEWFLTVV
jgi:hypothetical protein